MTVTDLRPAIDTLPRCTGCDRPMRPEGESRHDWPGTISRGRNGLCGGTCRSSDQTPRRGPAPTVPDFIPVPVPADWPVRAACRDDIPALWFSDHPDDTRDAITTCRSCPVRDACLTAAMAEEAGSMTRHGIRGGYTGTERRIMYRRQQRREKAAS